MNSSLPGKVLRAKQAGWRRRFPRFRTDFPLMATTFREQGYFQLQGRCSDIAEGGMGAVFNSDAQQGEVLALEFQLPNSQRTLSVRAIVRYQKGFVHGLEFLGLSSEQQSEIHRFCAALEISD